MYIPPIDSTYWARCHDVDPYHLLEQDIIHFQDYGEIILMGDYNARTSCKTEFVHDSSLIMDPQEFVRNENNSILDSIGRTNRNNIDTTTNVYGNKLLNICRGPNRSPGNRSPGIFSYRIWTSRCRTIPVSHINRPRGCRTSEVTLIRRLERPCLVLVNRSPRIFNSRIWTSRCRTIPVISVEKPEMVKPLLTT